MVQVRQYPFIIFLVVLSFSCLTAQEKYGQIQGVITDSTNSSTLFGANIWLKGTGFGAASDIDGNYRITQVPAGTYTIVVRYIGYKGKEFRVQIKGGETNKLNVVLISEALEGKEVVVTAQAQGQRAAINQQLTSSNIINVVSAEKIRELPDDNAATALSRLPGVSLMNGDQVVIRGVEAKLNQILINGIELPSTDMNNRSTSLGFISSNMLSGIEVVKAITPDMDANTLGGVVNLRLREAPADLHFDVLAQGNYNAQDRVGDNYKFWASVSDRFFNDKLGVFLQGNMDRTDGGNQSASITPTFLGSDNNAYGQATYITNGANFELDDNLTKTSGGSLILDYKLPDGKIVFQNTYAGNYTDQANNQIKANFDGTSVIYTEDRQLFGKDLWINALQAENTFGDIKVEASLSHSSTEQYTRFGHGLDPWTNFNTSTHPFGISGYDSKGNPIGISYNGAAEQGLSLKDALGALDNLDTSSSAASSALLGGWTSEVYNQFNSHLYNASLDVTAPVNLSNDITAKFKAGGKFTRTTRVNNIDENFAHSDGDLYANPAANNYFVSVTGQGQPLSASNKLKFSNVMNTDFKKGQYYLSSFYDFKHGGFKYVINNDLYDPWLKLSEQGWSVPLQKADSYKNDFNGVEQFSAGYVMGTFNIGPKLTVIAGVRYESYNMNYHANVTYVTHTVYGDCVSTQGGSIAVNDSTNPYNPHYEVPYSLFNVNRTDNNLFPDVLLNYKTNDWSDIRLAYTSGISRPDYNAIMPKLAFYAGNVELGNPLLKPATARNFDVVWSLHNNYIGLFTIDAYYKVIKNQMYGTSIYYANINHYASNVSIPDSAFFWNRFGFLMLPQYTVGVSLNNPNDGFIRGIEIDWQTNFWYLPGPLGALVLDINYTKSGSNTAYTILQNTVTTVNDTVNGRIKPVNTYVTKDTAFIGRLIQQANDVLNAAIGADYKGFHARLSFSLTGNVLNYVGTRPEEMSYTGDIYRWDFTIKQDMPIDGLSVSLNGTNIFHNGISTYRDYRLKPDAPITKNLVSVLYYPTTFQMNLRYSF